MDLRIDNIFWEEMQGDTSFQEKRSMFSHIFGGELFSNEQLREIWHKGIKHGIEIGLNKASLEGQKIELTNNTTNKRHIEFLEKFHRLAEEFECAIQYHQKLGMVVIDRKK